MGCLFVSDLHLSSARPEPLDRFLAFLRRPPRQLRTLYVLGDLFDQWLGDDDDSAPHPRVVAGLSGLSRNGTACFALRGNHDFLLGAGFEAATGCRLLPDPSVVHVSGTPVLLSHGDALCTDDVEYQQWRSYSRDQSNQRAFLDLSLETRSAQAAQLRRHADLRVQLKPQDIMDVSPSAVSEALRAHDVHHLVHGHTHRPAIHRTTLDGTPATRIVLGDWYAKETALWWDQDGYQLGSLEELGWGK